MESTEVAVGRISTTKLLFCLITLCLPYQAFSQEMEDQAGIKGRWYLSSSYRGSFPNFGDLHVAEREMNVPGVMTMAKFSMQGQVTPDINRHASFGAYRAQEYDRDYLNFAGSLGYSIGAVRIELEGMRNEFRVIGGSGSVHQEDPSYIALSRANILAANNYVVVKNDKVRISSTILSACYDINAKSQSIFSYTCLGISGNLVEALQTKKVTYGYYGKMGIGFRVTPDVSLYLGGYYHSLGNKDFNSVKLIVPVAFNQNPRPTAAKARVGLAYLGGEVGVRYTFAASAS